MKIREQNQSFKKQLLLQNSNKQQIKLRFQNIHLSNKPYVLKENRTNTQNPSQSNQNASILVATAPSHIESSPYMLSQLESGTAKMRKESKIKISSTNLPRQQTNTIKSTNQSYQNLQLSRISRSSNIENRNQEESERGRVRISIDEKGVEIIQILLEKAYKQEQVNREKIIQCLEILKKSKKVSKNNEQEEPSKPKFRIVKSAKKNSSLKEEKDDDEPGSPLKIQQKSSIQDQIQSNQQSNERKQYEPNALVKKIYSPISSPSLIKKEEWKLKMKKNENKGEDYQELATSQVRAVTSEEIISRMKFQQKSLLKKCQQRQIQLKDKIEYQKMLESQIKELKQKSEVEENMIIIKDIKFSLKVIKDEIVKGSQPQLKEKGEKEKGEKEKGEKEKENELEHLKMIIVAQNKEIERVHQKIVLLQKSRVEETSKKKQSRWQNQGFQD